MARLTFKALKGEFESLNFSFSKNGKVYLVKDVAKQKRIDGHVVCANLATAQSWLEEYQAVQEKLGVEGDDGISDLWNIPPYPSVPISREMSLALDKQPEQGFTQKELTNLPGVKKNLTVPKILEAIAAQGLNCLVNSTEEGTFYKVYS